MSKEFSIYFNEEAFDLLDKLVAFEEKKSGFKIMKIQIIEKALDDYAEKVGIKPKKRGKQIRAGKN